MAEGFICRRGGGGSNKSTIVVTAPAGSTVTATMGGKVKTAAEKNGQWQFKNCDPGTWTVKASLGASSFTSNVVIPAQGAMLVYYVSVVYRMTPEFTYTGDYEIVDDSDNLITDFSNWKGNWKIRFLTSGVFKITNKNLFNGKINVFCVGGGGGGCKRSTTNSDMGGPGGGGGYTTTDTVSAEVGVNYNIKIGAGGAACASGGNTTAFNVNANGGVGPAIDTKYGGDGGSGGGARGGPGANAGSGGSDGSNGRAGYDNCVGKGQGKTTREFGEAGKKLYSGGGAGGQSSASKGGDGGGGNSGKPGVDNLGGGGGGGASSSIVAARGGSGIVIIRNAR